MNCDWFFDNFYFFGITSKFNHDCYNFMVLLKSSSLLTKNKSSFIFEIMWKILKSFSNFYFYWICPSSKGKKNFFFAQNSSWQSFFLYRFVTYFYFAQYNENLWQFRASFLILFSSKRCARSRWSNSLKKKLREFLWSNIWTCLSAIYSSIFIKRYSTSLLTSWFA